MRVLFPCLSDYHGWDVGFVRLGGVVEVMCGEGFHSTSLLEFVVGGYVVHCPFAPVVCFEVGDRWNPCRYQ